MGLQGFYSETMHQNYKMKTQLQTQRILQKLRTLVRRHH